MSLSLAAFFSATADAAEPRSCAEVAGEIVSAQGTVEFREAAEWRAAGLGQALCDRDAVRTGPNSRAAIRLSDNAVLRLDAGTTLVLADVAPEPEEPSFLQLVFGAIQSFSRDPQTLEVDTPYINATIEGTEFALRVTEGQGALTVIEGKVRARNDQGTAEVTSGSAVVADAGSAPRAVLVADPSDAVSWGLYYPPAVSLRAAPGGDGAAIAEAADLAARNRADAAIARLDAVAQPSADTLTYKAALLLSVGGAEEASAILERVLAAEPDHAAALAQSAVIDVVRNDRATALAKAERAVAAGPDQAAPYLALSLAQQAEFRLEDARDTLLEATARVPDSPLVWARLSEVWLSLGFRNRSGEAADRALALDSDLERAHVMKGFAALTEYRTEAAAGAFTRAIALDPSDPLPRLGLGLARIREGALEAGRAEIDAAVALDSTRSLLRSYLGKAYFEEDRPDLAAEQFALAKQFDPRDPTPYLYDAIRLQAENRPGEALREIQSSIELNDNRAPYRGRLQLDQDAAARGASLGRIYEDLGFIQLGMREATTSQGLDPANAAAHRFLADIYRNERRRELARVSELTRAQLLQDIGLSPVQPSLTEANLNLVSTGGPANAGFNEYTALFQGDGTRFTASGVGGNDDTYGGEIAFAVQEDNVSVSVGGFEFRSDGFRPNFDVEHSIYDVFAQIAVTPELSLQFEVRSRNTENGDLNFNFDPDDFNPLLRQTLEEFSGRVGLRYEADPHNTTLVSFIAADRDQADILPGIVLDLGTPDDPFPAPGTLSFESDGPAYLGEIQHIYQRDRFNVTVGGALTQAEEDLKIAFSPDFAPIEIPFVEDEIDTDAWRLYAYGSAELPFNLTATVGISYDSFDDGLTDISQVSPKAGIEWRPIEGLRLRAAYMEVVKPPLVTNRTIEPTQVAGFNQYFDDPNGTASRRYGAGLDYEIARNLFVGGEATWRDLDVPFQTFAGTGATADHDEQTHRLYVSALPHPRLPVSLEVVYDLFEAEESLITALPDAQFPRRVETISVPLTVRYFDPSGFFGGVRGTYVHQEVERSPTNLLAEGDSDFFMLDADLGYRFPNRRGSVSLAVRNLLDQDFRYQDDGYREFGDEPSTGPYFPGIGVLGRLTINF